MDKTFFGNKTCDLCHRPATMYRLMGNFSSYLCDDKECDIKIRIKEGFFKISPFEKIMPNA